MQYENSCMHPWQFHLSFCQRFKRVMLHVAFFLTFNSSIFVFHTLHTSLSFSSRFKNQPVMQVGPLSLHSEAFGCRGLLIHSFLPASLAPKHVPTSIGCSRGSLSPQSQVPKEEIPHGCHGRRSTKVDVSQSFVRLPTVSSLEKVTDFYLFLFIHSRFHCRIAAVLSVSVNEWRNVWWRFIDSEEVHCT